MKIKVIIPVQVNAGDFDVMPEVKIKNSSSANPVDLFNFLYTNTNAGYFEGLVKLFKTAKE